MEWTTIKNVKIPFRNWLVAALCLVSLSALADYYFIHYLFQEKKEAQIELYNREVNQNLKDNCTNPSASSTEETGTCKVNQ